MAQQQAFDTEIAARKLDGEIAKAEADAVANAPADGAGLHQGMYGEVDPHTGRVLQTGRFDTLFKSFLSQVPPELHPGLAARKETLRTEGAWRMAAQQLQRRKDYEHAAVDTTLTTNAIAIGKADPDDLVTFEAAREQGLDLINKMGVDPGIRQQIAKDWYSTAAKTRFEALIAKDPQRALEIFGLGTPAADGAAADDSAQAVGNSFADGPKMAPGKEGRGAQLGRLPTDTLLADLSPDTASDLVRQAHAANAASLINARTDIALAAQNAPDAIANTGVYSGKIPGPETFAAVYGVEEGARQYGDFARKIDVGRQAFGMLTMSNQAIHAALRDAESGPAGSQDEQARYQVTAAAALKTLDARRIDPAGYVRKVFPSVDAAWSKITTPDSESWNREGEPDTYDPGAYGRAIAASVAAQKQLGIENYQPLPWSVFRNIATIFKDASVPHADKHTILYSLFDGASDPEVRAALSQQLFQAGLPQSVESQPAKPAVAPVAAGKQNQPPAPSGSRKPQSKLEQAADDFGNYLSEGFEALGRAPHDIGLALQDLRDSPLSFLEQLPVTPGSGAVAEGRLAVEAAGEAVAKGLAVVRGGMGRFARPLEEVAAGGSRATSELAAEAAVARQAAETKSLVKAADDVAYRVSTGVKLERAELLQIIKSIARDPSKVRYGGASLGRAASKNYRKTFLDANPNLQGEVVVHHAAERQVWRRFPSIVAVDEEHSLQNLRGIPKGLDNLLHKVIFRFEWDEFYESHPQPTRQQVLDYIGYIDKKYGHLFNPPIGE